MNEEENGSSSFYPWNRCCNGMDHRSDRFATSYRPRADRRYHRSLRKHRLPVACTSRSFTEQSETRSESKVKINYWFSSIRRTELDQTLCLINESTRKQTNFASRNASAAFG